MLLETDLWSPSTVINSSKRTGPVRFEDYSTWIRSNLYTCSCIQYTALIIVDSFLAVGGNFLAETKVCLILELFHQNSCSKVFRS
jgi:hypothetical protein